VTAIDVQVHPQPRYLTGTGPETSPGDTGLVATAELLRRPLRPWQEQIAARALEEAAGRWRYPMVVFSVPRQAGKTTFAAVVAMSRCLSVDGAQVWYTAQSRTDAAARLVEMGNLLRTSPLRGYQGVNGGEWDYRITMGAGNEAVMFPNGSAVRIFAPREDSLHGSVTDLVIIDEARFFTSATGAELMAAALPTQVTRNGQIWVTSTAGGPESTWLAELMEQGRASVDNPASKVCYAEWGIGDDVASGDLLEAVWQSHPAAGMVGGPTRAAVEFAAETMPAWQFAHEMGNRWRTVESSRLIPAVWWSATEAEFGNRDERVVLAVDAAPDRSAGAVVASAGGVLEVVAAKGGVRWLAGKVTELVERYQPVAVVVDPSGPAVTVADELRRLLGERLVAVKTRELVAACNGLYDAAEAQELKHVPDTDLDQAVSVASKRALSGSWAFSRDDGGHVLVAAALAHWAECRPADPVEGWFVS